MSIYAYAFSAGQANLRTRLRKIFKRAGLVAGLKPIQNLRSTRQTELGAQHPIHVECASIGNKAAAAAEHELQACAVADEDLDSVNVADSMRCAANAPQRAAMGGVQDRSSEMQKPAMKRAGASRNFGDHSGKSGLMGGEGLELSASHGVKAKNRQIGRAILARIGSGTGDDRQNDSRQTGDGADDGAANSHPSRKPTDGRGTPGAAPRPGDLPADLALVVNAWPKLTAGTRAAILAAIEG